MPGKFLRKDYIHLHIIKIIAVFFIVATASHCTLVKDYQRDFICYGYSDFRPDEFQKEIERQQKLLQKQSDAAEAAKLRFQLAYLYSHYKNPAPDYNNALEQLEKYVSLDPAGGKQAYIQNWLMMLKEITRAGVKVEQIKKDIARIEKENTETKEKLEQLKHLDIELEEKRRLVK